MIPTLLKLKSINLISFFIFLIIFILPSPIINYYILPGSYISIILALFSILLLFKTNHHIGFPSTLAAFILIIYALLTAFIIESTTIISLIIGLPLCLIVYSLCGNNLDSILNQLCYLSTNLFILATFCIIISVIYSYFGGNPIFIIENPDGRFAEFYLTSLSNSKLGNIIRPSFIYDEAGAYSFYLTITALVRVYLNKNKWTTLFLLYGSLVTFSVTHLIICTIFTFRILNIKQLIIIFLPCFFICLSLIANIKDDIGFFLNRLDVSSIHENNRTTQLTNFQNAIERNSSILIYGNMECFHRKEGRCMEDGDISSSPVTPLYRLGILGIIIQLSFLILSIWNLKKKNCIFIAIVLNLLLLQRPFYTSIYYSFSIFILVYALFIQDKKLNRN